MSGVEGRTPEFREMQGPSVHSSHLKVGWHHQEYISKWMKEQKEHQDTSTGKGEKEEDREQTVNKTEHLATCPPTRRHKGGTESGFLKAN